MAKQIQLKDTDLEDLEDVLQVAAASFNIQFAENELRHIETFGQFCDYFTSKLKRTHCDDCTTQQAFYKFRNALAMVTVTDAKVIRPDSPISSLLPSLNRRSRVAKLNEALGLELNLLRPPHWITTALLLTLLGSIGLLFIDWRLGLSGIGLAVLGFQIADRFGNELNEATVGVVVRNMATYRYAQSRRDPQTFNKVEVETVLGTLLSKHLGLDGLGRNARFLER